MWIETICLLITFATSLDPDQNRQNIDPDVDLLITFETSLDPDQNRQNIGPDVDRNYLSTDNLCKQFGSRSEPIEHWSWCGSKPFVWLITFATSLDPDQNQHNIDPDVDRNYLSVYNLCNQFGSRSEPTEH